MGLMNSMRNRGGLLVGVIGFAIVAFLAGDVLISGRSFFGDNGTTVGKVAGEKISYTDFSSKLEQNTEAYKQNSGQSNIDENVSNYLMDQTWNQMVYETIMKKTLEKSGVTLSSEELFDMIQGKNPHPEVRRAFTNPQTGVFDPAQVINFLKTMDQRDPSGETRKQWLAFEKSIKEERIRQKYFNMVKAGIYITSAEAKANYLNQSKTVNIKYAMLDYATISDSTIKVSESDLKECYSKNKYKYKQKEDQRTFDYIYLDIVPSSEDSAAVLRSVEELAANLKTSTDDSTFVALNAETKFDDQFVKKGQLSPVLDTILFNAPEGTVYGPYLEGKAYKVAKLMEVKTLPDSVRARHILLPVSMGMDAARLKADSIKKAIDAGADFAMMALQYSSDGSKDKGGDLGYFDNKQMVKPFSDASFNGKKGDRIIVESQFGIHLIEITDQKNFSRAVKVGVIDRAIEPSSSTRQALFAKANSLLSGTKDQKAFEKIELKDGFNKRVAENIKEGDRFIAGLDNPRELVRWAYKADKGNVSPLLEIGNKYVFACLTQVKDKGYIAEEYLKTELEALVRKEKKAEMLSEKLAKAVEGVSTIEQVAQKAGTAVIPAQGVNFSFPVIPGVAREPKVVGTCFGIEKSKLSKPVDGERGVYVVMIETVNEPVPLPNYTDSKAQLANTIKQRVDGEAMEALKETYKVEDNRVKFF
jgi:peptidyl-prolyl cis-trans isomerase D